VNGLNPIPVSLNNSVITTEVITSAGYAQAYRDPPTIIYIEQEHSIARASSKRFPSKPKPKDAPVQVRDPVHRVPTGCTGEPVGHG